MKHDLTRSAMGLTVAYMCLAAITAAPVFGVVDEADLRAISSFLAKWSFERPLDRDYALTSVEHLSRFNCLGELQGVRFYAFPTAASSVASHVALAVSDRGEVFQVGEEAAFNRLLRASGFVVSEPSEAERLGRDYLRLRRIHGELDEGVEGGVKFIGNVDDIPFVKEKIEHQVERLDLMLNHQLQPPSVVPTEAGFVFRGYAWGPFDGSVDEHMVTIKTDGTIKYRQSSIAYAYGDYSTGCTFPLDSGPTFDTLARLSKQSEAAARRTVASYIRFLTTSDFILHQWVLRDHKRKLADLAQELAHDTDQSVQSAAVEALNALDIRDEAR